MIKPPETIDETKYLSRYMIGFETEDLIVEFEKSKDLTLKLLVGLSDQKSGYRYAEGKWSIKQVLRHITDTERVFSYRALSYTRDRSCDLPSFDENEYAENDNSDNLKLEDIIEEFIAVRQSTIMLYKTMNARALDFTGKASGAIHTPRELGWVNIGHNLHHLKVLNERYL